MLGEAWTILCRSIRAFFDDNAISFGAAIAFYMATAFAPVVYIMAAIAGIVFGDKAASGAIIWHVREMIGPGGAKLVRAALQNTLNGGAGLWPNVIGFVLVIITASGLFGETQLALNTMWKVQAPPFSVWGTVRARLLSLALVVALGFMLLISLASSAFITTLGSEIGAVLPFSSTIAWTLNFAISFVLIAALFAAIYRTLPDVELTWRDVIAGALVTAALFEIGEFLISFYLANSRVGHRYGAASGLFVTLMWIYYTTQVFLLGAEFTKVYSARHGTQAPREQELVPA